MLLLFSIRVAEFPVKERAVNSVDCVAFVNVYQFLCVPFFPVWI